MYTTERIVTDDLILSYRYYKGGQQETLVAFHGFGQTNVLFESFVPSVLPYYSVIAVDLFFHGGSGANTDNTDYISIDRWNALFNQILTKHAIKRFSLLSYSMGSRFVVTLLNNYAARINKVVLIAPDGFGNNFWFRVATSTKITRSVFQYTMWHPFWIQAVVRILGAAGIFNAITKRFIERNLESEEHRKKVYVSWVYFRKLTITKNDFIRFINQYKIKLMCFCGKEDQLVSKKSLQVLCDETQAQYVELDLAHHKMVQALEKNELIDFLISNRQ
ncbi:alpha/beta hydrolase [Cytophaga aurantiaca]|uniref:alpha/beta hydrolase n=1 Tax=Cytophaga aurantiaca TaxID=29530 RepID=UPI0003792FD7|nr:alpha/beta hydrolase [Cytophaga aurantiaca]